MTFSYATIILLCLVGAGIILLSQSIAIAIRRTVSPAMRKRWLVIILLMGFFVIGYFLYIVSLFQRPGIPQEVIIGLVFFGGACFVYLIVRITQQTLQGLVEANKELEHEIAERLKTENELHRSQRIEALGTLTGGIAHEFNNILTSIIGYAEFLQDSVPKEGDAKKYTDMVLSSATRAAKLTESLLTYSRKQITRTELLDMNALLLESEFFLGSVIGGRAVLTVKPAPTPITLNADKSQLQQVLFNLVSNATDAMPDGGTLRIMLEPASFDGQTAFHDITIPTGKYAMLCVEDTGSGMSEETRQKMFEPFFTTKGVGGGTGLGLSVVYGIVKRHGGFISVQSAPGLGTKVFIFLPLTEAGIEN